RPIDALWLIGELERKQISVTENKAKPHFLTGKAAEVGAVLPRGALIGGVAVKLIRLGERESRERLAIGVLNFNPDIAGCGRGAVEREAAARELQRLRDEFAARQWRVQRDEAVEPDGVAAQLMPVFEPRSFAVEHGNFAW